MKLLSLIRDRLLQLELLFAAASLLLLLVLAVAQIIARNAFDAGITQADTLTRYLVLYVTFFGATLAVDRNRHIKIDVACTLLSTRTQAHLYRPLRALAAVICMFFADASIRFWRDEWTYAQDYERWQVIVGLILPVGFVLLTIHFLLAALLGPDDDACRLP
ncbi:TRAP-type C4-dicarboxylate transport system permease small subunit [Thiogranum longum]|uniref:TRAP transporter small permease protein n=1 Tax=Thiogranum longum TaxID=1537524 RepID=A0A4R1HAU3_9GAMM|nr:TRAP transporter small permease [Thiogranum longum]TCK18468.1 TRAP-type C4-dicarboxylate transport system permease small subunit [Thiogranum longum]